MASDELRASLDAFRADFDRLSTEISRVIVGHQEIIEGTLTALVAGGHVLLEGVPGLGKTLLVRTISEALHVSFSRIQFTPDLMPADLIGTNIIIETAEGRRKFEFQAGPIFSNICLADEINRATPKTQSALLEAMQEHAATVAGQTYPLPHPFFVLATQNPLEMEGTYPLPEAQLDRFFYKLLVRYPTAEDIEQILERTTEETEPHVDRVMPVERITEMRKLARQIPIAEEIRRYGVHLVLATHPENELASPMSRRFVQYGSSPRGAQALILAAKIRAIRDHRYHVAREDLQAVAYPALRHRLILNFEGQAEGIRADDVITDILDHVSESVAV